MDADEGREVVSGYGRVLLAVVEATVVAAVEVSWFCESI